MRVSTFCSIASRQFQRGSVYAGFLIDTATVPTEDDFQIAEDIRDVYGEAKASGFDPKIMRKIVSLRKSNLEKRREEQELLELYMSAIGMAE